MFFTPHFARPRAIQPSEIRELAYIPSNLSGIQARDMSGRSLFLIFVTDRHFEDLALWLRHVRPDLFTPQLVAQLKVFAEN